MTTQLSPFTEPSPSPPFSATPSPQINTELREKVTKILICLQLMLDQSFAAEDEDSLPILATSIRECDLPIDSLRSVEKDIQNGVDASESIKRAIDAISQQFSISVSTAPAPSPRTYCYTPSPPHKLRRQTQ
jgi:hypothetical protein